MIDYLKISGLIILFFNSFAMFGCEKVKPAKVEQPKFSEAEMHTNTTPLPAATLNSPIRKFDFKNFTYDEPSYGYLSRDEGIGYFRVQGNKHKLKDGSEKLIEDKDGLWENIPAGLTWISYADVTGDSKEEALIEIGISTPGTAIPGELHIFTWQDNKPKLLFSFATGDRAGGGFRKMYAESSDLIIELNAGDENAPDCDGCQSTRFLRLRYKWNGRKFVKVNQELFSIK